MRSILKEHIIVSFLVIISLSYKSKAQTNLESTLEDYQHEILGEWVLENHPDTKIKFTANGEIKKYYDNILDATDQYEITNTCDDVNQSDVYILKIIDQDGDSFCSFIEGLNFNGSNMMSLMTFNQGKIVVYVRP